MKTYSMYIFAFLLVIITLSNNTLANGNKNEKTVAFSVSIDCHSCVKKIQDNIAYEKGVKDLNVSLEKKEVEVTFRTDRTSTEMLIKAFKKLGYEAQEIGEKRKEEEKVEKKK
jgi:periplasmic mercuric ion binding protein